MTKSQHREFKMQLRPEIRDKSGMWWLWSRKPYMLTNAINVLASCCLLWIVLSAFLCKIALTMATACWAKYLQTIFIIHNMHLAYFLQWITTVATVMALNRAHTSSNDHNFMSSSISHVHLIGSHAQALTATTSKCTIVKSLYSTYFKETKCRSFPKFNQFVVYLWEIS